MNAQDIGCMRPRLAYADDGMRKRREGLASRPSFWRAVAMSSLSAIIAAFGCLPGVGPPIKVHEDDAGLPSSISLSGDGGSLADIDLGNPFAVTGLNPSHGPWTGGTHTTVAGRGFSSAIQVWLGSTQLDASSVFANDPTRVAVITPGGAAGPADVRIRNVSTGQERTLVAGFFYDSFVVSPDAGAKTGGTRITLHGSGTNWTSASGVAVGGQPCTAVAVTDATHLACTTPPGTAGSKDVAVTNADATGDQARDAFTYSDSADGYRGGLYGGALSGTLRVLAFDSLTGIPLTGGKAIAGSSIATAVIGTLDSSGVTQLRGPSLTGKITVTVAAKCHQPITFVDVPVDSVTAYLAPELDASCQGDPPSTGNWYPTRLGEVDGELVWTGGIEFQRAPWKNVPLPAGNEQRVAYVWAATGNPHDAFQLPPAGSATTPASDGVRGYAYATMTLPGNQTVYALAGLEDRSVNPPRFEPYVMGIVRGVLVQPAGKTTSVDIPMTTLLDHALSVRLQPPTATPRGPDRLQTTLAINVATDQFAVLPQGTATTLMPVSGNVSFVGVPSLDGTLSGAAYDLTAAAVSGANGAPPISVIKRIETTNANDLVTVTGFPAIPALTEPSSGVWNGTHVTLQASGAFDLVVVNVTSGNGLLTWQVVASGSSLSFDLPDLSQVPGVGILSRGPITTTFSIARLVGFNYAQLRYGQLKTSAWSAYAMDVAQGSY